MRSSGIDRREAETIAISGLSFIAGDDELLRRFLALSGIDTDAIRIAAREPGFLAGVLQFIAAHEPTIIRFSQESGIPAENVGRALRALPLGEADRPE